VGRASVFEGHGTGAACRRLVGAEWFERNRVTASAEFLVAVLELVELPVEAALGEELLVRAALAELALVHHEDGVGALNGREAVRDEDGGAACDHAGERETDT